MINAEDILHGKVLIVDDQISNVQLMKQMLRGFGYVNISSTTDPREVRELHRIHSYNLILLDLHMPTMDGFEVMEGLNDLEPDDYLPVLVISAHHEYRLRALNLGAKDFINKPFDFLEAKIRIHNMLEVRLLYQQLEETNRALEFMSLHDTLTGLPNRRLLMDRLTTAISHAKRNKSMMAVLYLDLDGFKQINDSLGHAVGDLLLELVAARLTDTVRQEDTVARLGGDEFVILLSEVSHSDDLKALVHKMLLAISRPYHIAEHSISVTASIGCSFYPTHGLDSETLMKHADVAMYTAKEHGKNNYHISSHDDLSAPLIPTTL